MLKENAETVDSFVVIDDIDEGWGRLEERVVITNPKFGFGLEEEHVMRAMRLLNGN